MWVGGGRREERTEQVEKCCVVRMVKIKEGGGEERGGEGKRREVSSIEAKNRGKWDTRLGECADTSDSENKR